MAKNITFNSIPVQNEITVIFCSSWIVIGDVLKQMLVHLTILVLIVNNPYWSVRLDKNYKKIDNQKQ